MPDNASLRVCFQIKTAYHDLTLFEIFAYGEGEEVLIDLSVQVELLNEERRALAAGHRS